MDPADRIKWTSAYYVWKLRIMDHKFKHYSTRLETPYIIQRLQCLQVLFRSRQRRYRLHLMLLERDADLDKTSFCDQSNLKSEHLIILPPFPKEHHTLPHQWLVLNAMKLRLGQHQRQILTRRNENGLLNHNTSGQEISMRQIHEVKDQVLP